MELIATARTLTNDAGPARDHPAHATRAGHTPRHHLDRPRLVHRLSTDAPVTLVVGPAGTGKSVALARWAQDQPAGTVAWVNVLSGQGARERFWDTVAEALGVELGAEPADAQLPLADAVLRLATAVDSTLDHDVVLVVDSYEVGEDADLAASMALFVRRLPDRLRLVIASRRVPLLPLDRLRVAGDLCELDIDDLRFTPSEARQLLSLVEPDIDEGFADTVITHADGWVAALRLGALAWAGQRDPSSSSLKFGQRIDQYVTAEVLAGEPTALVDFLADLAVVERASISLARAIAAPADAETLLELAEDRGLFVTRVGMSSDYAIHRAVRQSLLTAKERHDSLRVSECRLRAAVWHEAHGDTTTALELFLRADDHDNALRLLAERHVQLYDDGRESTVREFVAKLAPAATAKDVSSLVDLAWCQLITDLPAFRENVAAAQWWSDHGGDVDEQTSRRLRALQSRVALTRGDWDLAENDARAALDGLADWHDDPIVRSSWNDIARAIALSERWDDAADEVQGLSVVLRRDSGRTLAFEALRALGAALAGRPLDALRVAGGVRASLTLANLILSAKEVELAELIARRELGDHLDVEPELERLVADDRGPLTYARMLAAAELVLLHIDRGAAVEASRAFVQLEQIVTNEVNGRDGHVVLGRTGTLLSIELGDPDQASRWAETIDDSFWRPVSHARIMRAAGDAGASEAAAAAAAPRNPRHEVIRTMLQATTTKDRDLSADWTQAAVHLARSHGMLQTIASARELELIEHVAWQVPEEWMERLRRATATAHHEVAASASLLEPLTVRERDVLRFLPSRLTLKEIAEELFVSVNTLKFHLKIIYRKLGVNSRAEAAEIARSWGRVEHR